MNKKAIICTVAILILLVGASVIYFIMDRSSEAETENSSSMSAAELESSNSPLETSSEAPTESEPKESASETTSSEVNSPEADALIKTFAEIGEPYTLHSRYYNQGEAKTDDAPGLGWDGDLELCITDAIVKEYEESDIKYNSDSSIWARYASDFEDPCILHVELSLKNVDAICLYLARMKISFPRIRTTRRGIQPSEIIILHTRPILIHTVPETITGALNYSRAKHKISQ